MSALPPPLPRPARIEQLGGRWSPRARRFANGVIVRVPARLLKQWAQEHRRAQFDADYAFLSEEFKREKKREPVGQYEKLNLVYRAIYERTREMTFAQSSSLWGRICARARTSPDAEPHGYGENGRQRHWKELLKP